MGMLDLSNMAVPHATVRERDILPTEASVGDRALTSARRPRLLPARSVSHLSALPTAAAGAAV